MYHQYRPNANRLHVKLSASKQTQQQATENNEMGQLNQIKEPTLPICLRFNWKAMHEASIVIATCPEGKEP
jgi:hypothetical protein